jgi:hypothetical protein
MTEILDLSIATLMAACKGNVENLPSFMVHEDAAWVKRTAQLDNKNRIHIRKSTFLQTVCPTVPVREGIWHGFDVQEFHVDLKAHHLQGSTDMQAAKGHQHSRALTMTDHAGRNPGDDDYGHVTRKLVGITQSDVDAARDAAGGQLRGVGSAVFSTDSSE